MRADYPLEAFLVANGWGAARHSPLAGDASARRYERLHLAGGSAVLMILPEGSGLCPGPFLAATHWLRSGGFSAPEILAADEARGLILLEDLGDDLLIRLCERSPAIEAELYAEAVDLLCEFQACPPPSDSQGWTPPAYDLPTYLREALLAVEWYLPAATGAEAAAEIRQTCEALVEAAMSRLPEAGSVAVYRDYHAENLVWLPDRTGRARIGLLDYQDMLRGHPAYDLVSLLGDARRDVAPELRAAMTERYLARTGHDRDAFLFAAHLLSAQRNLKILGIFTRLSRRDGKPRYLALLPRVWSNLIRDLAHPDLAELQRWASVTLPAPDAAVLRRIAGSAS